MGTETVCILGARKQRVMQESSKDNMLPVNCPTAPLPTSDSVPLARLCLLSGSLTHSRSIAGEQAFRHEAVGIAQIPFMTIASLCCPPHYLYSELFFASM